MGQVLHGGATTTAAVRRAMRHSRLPAGDEAVIVAFRRHALRPLDDWLPELRLDDLGAGTRTVSLRIHRENGATRRGLEHAPGLRIEHRPLDRWARRSCRPGRERRRKVPPRSARGEQPSFRARPRSTRPDGIVRPGGDAGGKGA